jgi:AhpD family alkylhydroperoxidase
VTAVLKCDECLRLHSKKVMEAGVTKDEVREALFVAMYLAGPSAVAGMPSIDELLAKWSGNELDDHRPLEAKLGGGLGALYHGHGHWAGGMLEDLAAQLIDGIVHVWHPHHIPDLHSAQDPGQIAHLGAIAIDNLELHGRPVAPGLDDTRQPAHARVHSDPCLQGKLPFFDHPPSIALKSDNHILWNTLGMGK